MNIVFLNYMHSQIKDNLFDVIPKMWDINPNLIFDLDLFDA